MRTRGLGLRSIGLGITVVLTAGVLAACDPPASLTHAVTSTVDAPDAVPGDGACETATPDECTLRAAVMEANASPAGTETTIQLAPDATYVLTLLGAEDQAATGDLDVHARVTIEGNGATITREADQFAFLMRLFEHHSGRLRMVGIDLVGGGSAFASMTGAPMDGLDGGAILNRAALELDDVTISGAGTDGHGSAIHQVSGSAVLRRVAITGNDALSSVVSIAGGSFALVDSAITGNPATASAALSADYTAVHQSAGELVVVGSTISGNSVTAFVCDHAICGWATNTADGIDSAGTVTILRSTLTGGDFDIGGTGDFTVAGSILARCEVEATSLNFNYVSEADCLIDKKSGDIRTPVAAPLGLLGLNGGPTPNRVPVAGSVLVDAIPLGRPDICDGTLAADQRGLPQPVGAGCDIGAVERQPTDP
jgi:CSLREA domain-containing protein